MVPSSTRVLEEGMVVALEPHIGYWHLQDMVLITDDSTKAAVATLQHRRDAGSRIESRCGRPGSGGSTLMTS